MSQGQLFSTEQFTLRPRRDYDPEKWVQPEVDERGYDRTVFHGRTFLYEEAQRNSPAVGLPPDRGVVDMPGWHAGTLASAQDRLGHSDKRGHIIPLKHDTSSIPKPSVDAPFPIVGDRGERLASDMWANDGDENGAGTMDSSEYEIDHDALNDYAADSWAGDEEESRDQYVTDLMRDPWGHGVGRAITRFTEASDFIESGKSVPYRNQCEDEGSTSIRAPRHTLKTWREDVLSDDQAPPRWRRIAEAGMDVAYQHASQPSWLEGGPPVQSAWLEADRRYTGKPGGEYMGEREMSRTIFGDYMLPSQTRRERLDARLSGVQFGRDRNARSNIEWGVK